MKKKDLTFNQASRLYNLPRLVDTDKDGVINMFDCHPYDPNRDGLFGRAVNILSRGKYGRTKEDYEKEKIEKAQAKLEKVKNMPREPVYNEEHEYKAKEVKEQPKRKSSEPYLLYIKHGLTEPYVLVGQFDTSFEASRYLEENYKNFPHKIMSVSAAIAEGKKQEERTRKRKEMITKVGKGVVTGAKAVGRGAVAIGRGAAMASEKLGEAETKYKEYWERRDIKALEREEKELERLRMANERAALRLEQQELKEQQRLKAEQLRAELREQTLERERYKQPTRQSYFQPPSPTGFRLQPPPSMAQQRPFGGIAMKPASITIQAPRSLIWTGPLAPKQPTPFVKKKKKTKMMKSKRKK